MGSVNSIREELHAYMNRNQMIHSHFAELAGLNSGTLSRILKGKHPISMAQLAAITAGMKLPEDYFFEDYIEECFSFVVSMRRIRPFIFRSAELERLDCLEQIVNRLLEDLSYASLLFEFAELFYEDNKSKAARILYQGVSEAEKYQHSERLALCQYRIFQIELEEQQDLEEKLRAATQFELYVNRLDAADQLDAMKQLMHIYGLVHKWKRVDELAKEMHRIASVQYELEGSRSNTIEERVKCPDRPFYYYILYAYLARSTASEECGDYKRALSFVKLYANGERWVQENDEESRQVIAQFTEWAVANTYLYRLMSGDLDVIHEYADYIAIQEDEIFVAVRYMVQAANIFKLNIDSILERFAAYIPYESSKTEFGEYNQAILQESYAQFLIDLAVYFFNHSKSKEQALNTVLKGLEISIRINSSRNMIACMTLFEQYRDFADQELQERFKNLSSEVCRLNAKKSLVLLDAL
ncbi:helix-turn-helix domain-containing protein [Paenibacillus sp. FSL R7-277]|uniref:helix-turn-helix domain-containing protein n=1 Tax=Paenibacillus sp. FSL R7-277 TaxID=1227352 RepID=UPI0003E23666|nr:helix-turn-helix transcriptional regulator [Paenibacillus sp. FSL R7-277]ETT69720.1 helix-turn-helix domain-containing protein [Paenibacillus sp. FSL R7-277]